MGLLSLSGTEGEWQSVSDGFCGSGEQECKTGLSLGEMTSQLKQRVIYNLFRNNKIFLSHSIHIIINNGFFFFLSYLLTSFGIVHD